MSIVAEFTVPAHDFALEDALRAVPGARVEIERLATHSREWVMPFVWVAADDVEAFEEPLRSDPTVESVTRLEDREEVVLYNVRWAEEVRTLLDDVVDRNGIVVEAAGKEGIWYLKLRFLDRESMEEFRAHFAEGERGFEVLRIVHPDEPRHRKYGLTAEQLEALDLALERGYFRVPRESTLDDLAAALDVSRNSVSQRLRRGHEMVLRHTIGIAGEGAGAEEGAGVGEGTGDRDPPV